MTSAAQADSTLVQPGWMPPWMQGLYVHLDAHPFLLGLGIVVVGLLLAFAVRAALLAGGASLTRHTNTDLDDQLMRLAARVAALVIGYLSVVAALEVLPLPGSVTRIVVRALLSLMIVQLMRAGLNAVHIGLDALSRIQDRFALVEERTVPLFDLGLTILVVGIAGYALLQVWNINPAAWLASAGVVGIAVGFAARDTLANLFAGFFIIADAPYKMGDYVVLDSGERGEVTRVGVRSTRLLTRDDVEIIIPNSVMAGTKIINESGGPWVKFRIRLAVGVAYGSDVDQVVGVLERIAREHERVCTAPAPRVRMRGFGDSSLDFELLCWVDHPSERGLVSHELFMDVYKALNREGIEIPFPQRDLWVRGMPGPAPSADTEAADGPWPPTST